MSRVLQVKDDEITPEIQTWIVKQVFDVCQCSISFPFLSNLIYFEGPKHLWIMYEENKEIQALAFLHEETHKKSSPYLRLDALCSRTKGSGLGSLLLKKVIQTYSTQSFPILAVRALPNVIPFYTKFGFRMGHPFYPKKNLLSREREMDGLHMTYRFPFHSNPSKKRSMGHTCVRSSITYCQAMEAQAYV